MSKRRSVSISLKKEVISYIEDNNCSVHKAYTHFTRTRGLNYSESQFYQWWRKKEEINGVSVSKKRCYGAGRPTILGNMEELLFDVIVDMRIRKMKVTRTFVQAQATILAQGNNIDGFKASSTWCTSFMNRFKLSLRQMANLTTRTDDQLVQRTVDYMTYLESRKTFINKDVTLLMDETAVYFEDARSQTIDFEGRRHVIIRSTGFASMRITACVSFWANGRKAAPLLIHKGNEGAEITRHTGPLLSTMQEKAWVNSKLLIKWIDALFPFVDVRAGKCIVWDSCRAHISKAVKNHCRARKIELIVIPGGCTPYLQVGDIGVFRELKDRLSTTITAWKESDEVEYSRNGNPKPPDSSVVQSWFRDAWRATNLTNISNSIASAGFSDNWHQWHIAKHDVYDEIFHEAWENRGEQEVDPEELELIGQLDDLVVNDE